MSIEALMARVSALEARVAILENGKPAQSTSSGDTPTDTFSDDKLDNDWANKTVAKDIPRWKGESMVGRQFADCPAEWHDAAASFCEWKAAKGRNENPVRMNNKGKPWHEQDTFTAKLHRTWAKRIRERGASMAADIDAMTPAPQSGASDDLPF